MSYWSVNIVIRWAVTPGRFQRADARAARSGYGSLVAHDGTNVGWKTVWSASVQEADREEAGKVPPEICRLLLASKNPEAQALLYHSFTCKGPGSSSGNAGDHGPFGCYQVLGLLTIWEKKMLGDWRTSNTRAKLGASLLGQKKYAAAEPFLLSGFEGMKQRQDKISASEKQLLKESLQRVVQLYEATGDADQTAGWKLKLAELDKAEAGKKAAASKP